MKQYIKLFSSSSNDELTNEINTYLEENNCKIISTQLAMSSNFPNYKTVLIIFEEIEEC
jgi:hypothetical protein